jgi:competence protein ComEC
LFFASAGLLTAAKNLEVYFVDVEGGQATLMVAPSGESLLVDTGWGGHNHRDADRIAAAAKRVGVKKIDYLVITHFHSDHVGGVAQLVEKMPVVTFVDHGASVENSQDASVLFKSYAAHREKGKHLDVKPGDTIPIKGLDVKVVASGGAPISAPLSGAGKPNPECSAFQKLKDDPSENAQSVGIMVQYGDFRMLDLGDLTWNKEYDLVCPANKLGPVDVYVVTHHGADISGSPQLVHAISPRVAIMNNGARKGGTAAAWQIIHDTPGLQDFWQLHYAVDAGKQHNAADPYVANLDEACEGKELRLTAMKDGSFTVYNARTKYEKSYPKR